MCVCFANKAALGSSPFLPMPHTLRKATGHWGGGRGGRRPRRKRSKGAHVMRTVAWSRARGTPEASGTLPVVSPTTVGCRSQPRESLLPEGPSPALLLGKGDPRIPGSWCQWEAPRAPHCFLALTIRDRRLQGSALPVPQAPLVPGLLQMTTVGKYRMTTDMGCTRTGNAGKSPCPLQSSGFLAQEPSLVST